MTETVRQNLSLFELLMQPNGDTIKLAIKATITAGNQLEARVTEAGQCSGPECLQQGCAGTKDWFRSASDDQMRIIN